MMLRLHQRKVAQPTCWQGLFLAAITVLLWGFAKSTPIFDIYRLIQSDLDGVVTGSSSTSFRALATLPTKERLARAVVVIPPDQVKPEVCAAVLQAKSGIEGLLLVLPQNYDKDGLKSEEQEGWRAVQHLLITSRVDIPVYFAVQNEATDKLVVGLQKMIDAGKPPSPTSSGYTLVAKKLHKGLPQKLPPGKGVNFVGMLTGSQAAGGATGPIPTIAITANYDNFLVAPALAGGADGNGSGAVALLQLLRIFSRLYRGVGSRGKYNLLFLLSSGGPLHFEGTAQYLNQVDGSSLEAVEFAICLDSLAGVGPGAPFYLHYSKPPKDAATLAWYQALASAAERRGIQLEQVHKKINISSPAVAWEHEQFSRRRILAATLSAHAEPLPFLERSGLHDQLPGASMEALRAATYLVGDALAHITYPAIDPAMDLMAADAASPSSSAFMTSWLGALSSTPRQLPFLATNSTLVRALERVFNEAADKPGQHVWDLDPARFKFWGETVTQLEVYRSPSVLFHTNLLLFNIVYLGGLFVVLRVWTRGWDDLVAAFRPSPKKHRRSREA